MNVEATVVIDFDGESASDSSAQSYIVHVEVDEELNLDPSGEPTTQFSPGDDVYIQYNYSGNLTLDAVVSTAGDVSYAGDYVRNLEVQQLFESRDPDNPTTYSPGVATSDVDVVQYIGRQGSISVVKEGNGIVTVQGTTGRTPFIADLSVSYRCGMTRLRTPEMVLGEDETYPIAVVYYFSYRG